MAVSLTHPPSPLSSAGSDVKVNNTADSNEGSKRKSSRRANTAERRATHNAVERQRRETLNGRFLELAGMLPNLSQIRRPSKSSIVISSIAHVNASRRHRMLAARELRSVKLESDALRRELNEWRDRAGLPRVEEPTRSEGFNSVLGGEMELEMMQEDAEDQDAEDDLDFGPIDEVKKVQAPTFTNNVNGGAGYTSAIHQQPLQVVNASNNSPNNNSNNTPFAYGLQNGSPYSTHTGYLTEADKLSNWNVQLYAALASQSPPNGHHGLPMYSQTQSPQHAVLLPTPPSTSHSLSGNQDFFGGRRERSGSFGTATSGSSFGSPPTYEFDTHHAVGIPISQSKRGLQIDTDLAGPGTFGANNWQSPVVSIGHGGSGQGGFMMMMM